MWVGILLIGFLTGYILSKIIDSYSLRLSRKQKIYKKWISHREIIIVTGIIFLFSFLILGFTIILVQALLLDSLLIVATVIDLRHRLITNVFIAVVLISCMIFLLIGNITIVDALLGMAVGGGLLYIFSLIPGAMGGGDVKFMLAMGLSLGVKATVWALMLGFVLASVTIIFLLAFKIIGRKDRIPFGPFLSFGCFAAFHFITAI
jgi:prepilin signal peptidase PulO-like enzyme (type II secretory pathway)